MKKILLVFTIIFLCGCSNKLVCTYKEKYDDVIINNKIIFDFKANKYKQIDTMQFKNEESAKEYYKDIDEYKEEYNLELKNNKIISILETDIKIDSSLKEIKERYESYDYVCK